MVGNLFTWAIADPVSVAMNILIVYQERDRPARTIGPFRSISKAERQARDIKGGDDIIDVFILCAPVE